jgi:hypothetical protein
MENLSTDWPGGIFENNERAQAAIPEDDGCVLADNGCHGMSHLKVLIVCCAS